MEQFEKFKKILYVIKTKDGYYYNIDNLKETLVDNLNKVQWGFLV